MPRAGMLPDGLLPQKHYPGPLKRKLGREIEHGLSAALHLGINPGHGCARVLDAPGHRPRMSRAPRSRPLVDSRSRVTGVLRAKAGRREVNP